MDPTGSDRALDPARARSSERRLDGAGTLVNDTGKVSSAVRNYLETWAA